MSCNTLPALSSIKRDIQLNRLSHLKEYTRVLIKGLHMDRIDFKLQ